MLRRGCDREPSVRTLTDSSPEERLVGWRWQYVSAAVVAIATGLLAVFALIQILNGKASTSGLEAPQQPSVVASQPPPPMPLEPEDSDGLQTLGKSVPLKASEPCRTPTSANGSAWQLGQARVAGKTVAPTFYCNLLSSGVGSLDFVTGKAYRQLTVTIAFADDSPFTLHNVRFELIGDDTRYLAQPRVLKFGQSEQLTVDLSGISRLKLKITELGEPGGNEASSLPVWANPVVTPAS